MKKKTFLSFSNLSFGVLGATFFVTAGAKAQQATPPAAATPAPASSQPAPPAPLVTPSAAPVAPTNPTLTATPAASLELQLKQLQDEVQDLKGKVKEQSSHEPAASGEPQPPAPEEEAASTEEKPSEPFAFADFTWLNGNSRQHKAILDTPYFTPEILFDVNYTTSRNNPIDHTVVGSTGLSRNNEFTLAFLGFGGDLHYGHARGRIMTQFGVRSVLVPRNDASTYHGQFDLMTALRYVSEAYGGYHFDAMHGINLDAGIFMSYVGLFSYDNFENWMYLPSYTSDNTPWFFNGLRLQIFPSDKLKIEPWLINGWQTYGKFTEKPGFGAQILWRPTHWFSVLTNDYVGWDTQDNPGRFRFHSDNSVQVKYYEHDGALFHRAAFSLTGDIGGEIGDGVTAFGGHSSGDPTTCTNAHPCTQQFLSWMVYNRLWFFDDHFAFMVGGGQMHNPGRYLVLSPTGNANPFPQPLSIQGIEYTPASQPFSLNPGTKFDAFDYAAGFQYMPDEQVTVDLEFSHRHADTPYFAGHGGVTSPDGYITTKTPPGWRPDLVKDDTRLIAALLVRF
ncbi:MAG TPA: outer membrane beta-barrel protein [Polyangiaceae bacterium]|nr:outer membrane beta-barrel protein [Polyangiaceae bacterium]